MHQSEAVKMRKYQMCKRNDIGLQQNIALAINCWRIYDRNMKVLA